MNTPDISTSRAYGADTPISSRNRLLIPLAAVVVATLLAGLTYVVSGRSSGSPAVLQLAGVGSAGTMSSEQGPAAAGTSADSRSSAEGAYRLSGELPAGRPEDSPVYAVAGPFDTSRLAKVLDRRGLTSDRAAWWWSQPQPCAVPPVPDGKPGAEPAPVPPDAPVSSDGSSGGSSTPADQRGVSCAVSGGGTSSSGSVGTAVAPPAPAKTEPAPGRPEQVPPPAPEPTTPAMSEAQARDAAAPVFDAVDLNVGDAEVTVSPWGASVWLNPVVHGLPTMGYTTRIELGEDRQITYASGFLGDLSKGDTYPLVTARAAFDSIDSPPMTDMMCRVGPNGEGCLPPPQPEITGAILGLALQQTNTGDQLLVPAWLFTVKGWTEPMPQVAVEGRYLGQPEPEPTAPTSKDGGGADGSGGQTEPGVVIDPAPPGVPPRD